MERFEVGSVLYAGEHGERIVQVNGYDGRPIVMGDRVELHPACDMWMRGARFGKVVGFSQTPDDRFHIVLDRKAGIYSASADSVRRIPETEVERIMRAQNGGN